MKVGDILFFSGNGFTLQGRIFSWAIRTANKIQHPGTLHSKWTHVAMIYSVDEKKGVCMVAEALNRGVVISPYGIKGLNDMIKEGLVESKSLNYPVEANKVQEALKKYEGAPYGWLDIFHIILYTIFGKKSFILSTGAKQIICSEYVARAVYDFTNKAINYSKEYNKEYSLITPLDIYLSKNGFNR